MKDVPPRVKQVIKMQMRAALFNGVLSLLLTTLIMLSAGITDIFVVAVISFVIAYVISRFLNFMSAILIQLKVYGKDVEAMKKEMLVLTETAPEKKPEQVPQKISLKVIGVPETVLGRYQDANFYEWIDVEDVEGKTSRLYFDGTVDMTKNFTIQPNTVTFPPGIIYRWKTQVDHQ